MAQALQDEVSFWTARHPCPGAATGETRFSVNSFPLAFMALIPKEVKIHRERWESIRSGSRFWL